MLWSCNPPSIVLNNSTSFTELSTWCVCVRRLILYTVWMMWGYSMSETSEHVWQKSYEEENKVEIDDRNVKAGKRTKTKKKLKYLIGEFNYCQWINQWEARLILILYCFVVLARPAINVSIHKIIFHKHCSNSCRINVFTCVLHLRMLSDFTNSVQYVQCSRCMSFLERVYLLAIKLRRIFSDAMIYECVPFSELWMQEREKITK